MPRGDQQARQWKLLRLLDSRTGLDFRFERKNAIGSTLVHKNQVYHLYAFPKSKDCGHRNPGRMASLRNRRRRF